MADNSTAQAVTSAGETFASDDISSVKYPRCKLIHGADGVNDGDISTGNPLPVRLYAGTTAITVGAGSVNTGVLRVTLASDDPLIAATLVDDAAFTPATSKVLMAGYEFDDTGTDSVNEGDAGAARMSGNRCQYVMIRDNAGNERGLNIDASGNLSVATVTTVTNIATIGTSVTPGTSAAHLGKAEDAAHGSGDTGVFCLAVRSDTAAATGQTDGDYTALVTDSSGRLHVNVGSFTPGTSATSLGKAIDTATGATDTGVLALVTRDDALTTLTPADGDNTTIRVDSTGQVWVRIGDLAIYTTDAVAPAAPTGLVALVQRDDALSTLTPADGDWAGPPRVDSVGAAWVRDRSVLVDDAAFTPGTSFVVPVGMQADETAADSVDEGDVGCPRMTLDRKQRVVAELDSTSIRGGSTARTPAFDVIDHAGSGDNTIVAAAGATLKIRVLSYVLVSAGTVTARFESGASGTALTGQMSLVANTVVSAPFNPLGHFETAADTLLNLELSGAVSVDGHITYITTT